MQMKIGDWGTSAAVRLPKTILQLLEVKTGDKLHAEVYGQKLVLTKADNDRKRLDSTDNCNI